MKIRWILTGVFIAAAIVICFINIRAVKDSKSTATQQPGKSTQNDAPNKIPSGEHQMQPDARLAHLPDGRVEYKPALATSRALGTANTPEEALIIVEQLLSHYRFAYKENPVGVENFEITEQLLGKNPKKIVFIAPESTALRGKELIDPWGTPYFFHALSAQQMDIRSAGPDTRLWTQDDVVLNQ